MPNFNSAKTQHLKSASYVSKGFEWKLMEQELPSIWDSLEGPRSHKVCPAVSWCFKTDSPKKKKALTFSLYKGLWYKDSDHGQLQATNVSRHLVLGRDVHKGLSKQVQIGLSVSWGGSLLDPSPLTEPKEGPQRSQKSIILVTYALLEGALEASEVKLVFINQSTNEWVIRVSLSPHISRFSSERK